MRSNILFICPSPTDATSWYRGYGPFGELRKKLPDISLITGVEKFTWAIFQMTDITFMQRPYSKNHLTIAEMSKDSKNLLWVDFDDDLFSVPQDNPTYDIYSKDDTQRNIATIIAMADVVTVSTLFLKRRLEKLNKNIHVINNAFNDYLFNFFEPKPFSDRPKFFNWRGSKTHHRDILVNSMAILNMANKSLVKNWKWHWIGYNPWYVNERFKDGQVIISEGVDVMEYHKFIAKLQPTCQIVPLADSKFNRSKSNIAWIEATYSGAVTIAPLWEEWNHQGVFNYECDIEKSFQNRLEEVMETSDSLLQDHLDASRELIMENYLLSKINKQRVEIIEGMRL